MLKEKLLIKALKMIYTSTTKEHLEVTKNWLAKLFSHPNYIDLFSIEDIVEVIRFYRRRRAILLHRGGEPKD